MAEWIPLMEYAMKKGVSLSTLRRHIKANKIQYKVEDGRYLLFDDGSSSLGAPAGKAPQASLLKHGPSSAEKELMARVTQLEKELQKAREEIAELKTLIALYEEKMPARMGL